MLISIIQNLSLILFLLGAQASLFDPENYSQPLKTDFFKTI